ncbi:MAG: TetR/AcrR family transcriptional regulator [Lachnospiraceae bacterium]|nr:TetR/AcrR family transcriptional regulator [Lachnospiraceae bacterium]
MGEKGIRIPKQKRSMEKKQRIKNAAIRLMAEKGYHSTSSNEIAKEAGVSIGTFYSYYKDKKELYKELVADIYNAVLAPMNMSDDPGSDADTLSGPFDALDKHSIEETVYLYIQTVFKGHEYETAFQREIASLSEQSDEFREIEMVHKRKLTKTFTSILSAYKDELKVRDLKTASYLILTTVEAAVHDTLFHNGGKNKKAVSRELTAMIVAYLF